MLAMEDVAEGYGVIQQVPNVITANRSIWDKAHGTSRYFIAKSRSSSTDHTIVCKSHMEINTPYEFASETAIFMAWQTMENKFIMSQLDIMPTSADPPEDRQALLEKDLLKNMNNKAQLPTPVFEVVTQQKEAEAAAAPPSGEPVDPNKTTAT
jgi:hypothetical protein